MYRCRKYPSGGATPLLNLSSTCCAGRPDIRNAPRVYFHHHLLTAGQRTSVYLEILRLDFGPVEQDRHLVVTTR